MSKLVNKFRQETGKKPHFYIIAKNPFDSGDYYSDDYVDWLEKLVEEKFTSTNKQSTPFICPSCDKFGICELGELEELTVQPSWCSAYKQRTGL